MKDVGGEFQTQRVAIKSILGDIEHGNMIFGQLKQLAVVSPFQFKDLASYTKQLAAFSIPYSELYDTTKSLADISAGLGVDMSRIILAYGQVRSATVLKGQELRQFTEAGIPMVQALADEYSKLNGRIVTTGEVFDKIRKKEVTFEMVKKVLMDMTKEGGKFNDMQMVLADTISGKWSNLQDAWEIMIADMTASGTIINTTMNGIISVMTYVVELLGKMPTLVPAAVTAGTVFVLWKKIANMWPSNLKEQLLNAKAARAAAIEQNVLANEQTAIQKGILATKTEITREDIKMLAAEGKLSTKQMASLARHGLLDAKLKKELLDENLITAEQSKQIGLMSTRIGLAWSLVAPYAAIAAFAAAIAIGTQLWNRDSLQTDRAGESADNAAQRFKELDDVISGLKDSSQLTGEELEKAMDGVMDKLREFSPYYEEQVQEAENISNLTDRYDFLKQKLAEVADSYRMAANYKELFDQLKSDDHEIWEDNLNHNLGDYNKQRAEAESLLAMAGDSVRNSIHSAIRKAFPELSDKSISEIMATKIKTSNDYAKLEGLSSAAKSLLGNYVSGMGRANAVGNDAVEKMAFQAKGIINELIDKGEISKDYANNTSDKNRILTLVKTLWGSDPNYNDNVYKNLVMPNAKKIFGFWIPGLVSQNSTTPDYASLDNGDGNGSGSGADKELTSLKKKIQLYKEFYDTYIRYKKYMESAEALDTLEKDNTFESIFGFGFSDITDFESSIKELLATLALTTQERQDYADDVTGDIGVEHRKRFTESMDTLNNDLKTSLDLIQENFDMFAKWRKVVNDESAFKFAFGDVSDESGLTGSKTYGDYLLKKAEDYLKSVGKEALGAEYVLTSNDATFNSQFGENAEEISVYRTKYLEFQKKMRKETMDAIYEIINGHVDINAKIAAETESYEQQLKLLNELNMSEDDRATAKKNLDDAHTEKLSELQFEKLQKETDWVSVFDDMSRVSSSTIDRMVDDIDEFSRTIGLSINVVKKLRDALEKLKKEQNSRNPIGGIGMGMNRMSYLNSLLGGDARTFSISGKKDIGIVDGTYTRRELENMRTSTMEDLNQNFGALADAFGEVEKALTPVIDLFDALGDSTLSNIFKAGGNALSAASNTYSGFQGLANIAGGMKLGEGVVSAIGNAGPYAAAAAAAIQVGSSLIKTALADSNRKKYEEMKDKLDDINGTLKEVNSNLKESIGVEHGSKSLENGIKYLSNLKASEAYTRETAAQYLKIRNNILGRSKDTKMFNGAKNYGYNGTSWKSVSGQISSEFGVPFASMEDLLKMNAGTLDAIREKYWGLWSALDPEFRDLLNSIIDIEDESEKLKDSLIEAYTGYSFDNLRNAFYDFATDASKGIADLGRDFENTLRNAIINGMITDLYGDRIDAIHKKMAEYRENDDKVVDGLGRVVSYYTAEESKSLRNTIEGLGEEIKESKDIIDDALGFSNANSASLSKSIGASMTEESASLIGSYLNSIRADVSAMKLASISFFAEMEGTGNVLAEQLASLKRIESNVTRMAGNSSEILSLLNDTIKGSKSFRVS